MLQRSAGLCFPSAGSKGVRCRRRQWALAILAEDTGSVPSIHSEWLAPVYTSSSGDLMPSSSLHDNTYIVRPPHIHIKELWEKKGFFFWCQHYNSIYSNANLAAFLSRQNENIWYTYIHIITGRWISSLPVMMIKPRAFHILAEHCTIELYSQAPFFTLLKQINSQSLKMRQSKRQSG